jgi:hypothetical protein
MRSGFLASFLSCLASVSHAALAEDVVGETDDRSFAERGVHPILLVASMDAHLTLRAQPGFEMAVERFAFGLAMMLNGRVASTDANTGFGVGVKVGLGGAIRARRGGLRIRAS